MRSSTTSGRSPIVGLVRSKPEASRNPEPCMYSSSAGMRARSSAIRSSAGASPVSRACDAGSAFTASITGASSGGTMPDTGDQPSKTANIGTGSCPVHCMAWRMKSPTGSIAAALKRWCWNHIAPR